ncbi:1-acyl-sn-glycerol-3-phosphate acyltransferase [Leptolyngbya sp. FACHB-261]|uniref:1-acyl-sn-glycerol-3-phosphate acyltransferase n=1 Tax=Leptolyngbya sp. FACHB-261 TaxID=2692806 RepID=UPI0016827485|nr:1-acyl-sn-glycerol-3-phosphate acyltransferase [Leptolyngbya sp. FACHB-261]MBD2100781.1 1-acyl-sn-glycerol-3-phosphate acyltransferase [Leptolyngbya sp. FACHB-261]
MSHWLQAQPPLSFLPPAFNPWVLRLTCLALPGWLQLRTQVAQIETRNLETLAKLYQEFQTGKVRFLLAFRHPSADDPFSLLYLLNLAVPQAARRFGIPLQPPTHAHFIYDRGIPLWAGQFVTWLYPRLGATPIQRGKVDRTGLRSARDLFMHGRFPLAAAPEGGTNGHGEVVSPLEPGIAQLGLWCVEDLAAAGQQAEVMLVPLGVQYSYVNPPWAAIDRLLSQMEADCGLSVVPSPPSQEDQTRRVRLLRLGEHLLRTMEEFYHRFYDQPLPEESSASAPTSDAAFSQRLQTLMNTALRVAEQYFDLPVKGTVIDRCRRLEQAGWDRIFREDFKQPERLPPLVRGLADRVAEEASLRMWHMRLVESFVAVTGNYVQERPTAERVAETALLLWDTLAKIKGNPRPRPRLGRQRVLLTVGTPLSVSERARSMQGRRAAKQVVADLTRDLQTSLESLIVPLS